MLQQKRKGAAGIFHSRPTHGTMQAKLSPASGRYESNYSHTRLSSGYKHEPTNGSLNSCRYHLKVSVANAGYSSAGNTALEDTTRHGNQPTIIELSMASHDQ